MLKKTRNRKKNFPYHYVLNFSLEEKEKIIKKTKQENKSTSLILRESLLDGGILQDEEIIIQILRRSESKVFKYQLGLSYSEEVENKINDIAQKTGSEKSSIFRSYLKKSKLI